MGLQSDAGFVATMKLTALDVCKAAGTTCTYTEGVTSLGTLYCVAGPEQIDNDVVLDCTAQAVGRQFEIPAQTGFAATNAHVSDVITYGGKDYIVKKTENPDGLGIWFLLYAVYTHLDQAGAN